MNIIKTVNNNNAMTSLDLLEVINTYRLEDGKNPMLHKNFIVKIEDELESNSAEFQAQYKDASGKVNKMYNLPKDECMLVAMRESKYVRKQTVEYLKKLEGSPVKLPTTMKEVALLLLKSEEEKELLQEENKTLSVVSEKKSLKNYTPTKLLGFLYKEGIVKPDQGLAVSDINEALVYSGYQTKYSFRRSGSTVNSYTLTEKGVNYAIQITSGVTSSCKWVYIITEQKDFIDVLENILSGKYY